MIVTAIKTERVEAGSLTLQSLLDKYVADMPRQSVLAITSKIVSLCENRVVPHEGTDKQALVEQEAEFYTLADASNKWGIRFTVTNGMLIPTAGIDESNVGDVYALWPEDPQASANAVREYLAKRFGHDELAVVITDSTSRPLRRGVSGVALAYSGLKPLNNYVNKPDLFGRPFKFSQADIVDGLAATAVLVAGEGAESTPLVLLSKVDFAEFVPRGPNDEELAETRIALEEDLFAPLMSGVQWLPGGKAPNGSVD
ncbi:MAG TPA: coenzyme F420-0:L-glutamate ligase [Candidatus Saccharimonadales bacterium]|nr:coenzyme F420-0:L-glutamate ligase [Candidatus Saccharimonadales bacterium]